MKYKFTQKHNNFLNDIQEIINDKIKLKQLYANYNILNEKYSYIRYKFL